jgi:hypothetical protein
LQARAEEIQLTLSCRGENVYDGQTKQEGPSSDSFSAIVRMSGSEDASIEATTDFCPNYEGSFSELEVFATCYRTADVGDSKFAFLAINRVSGTFELTNAGGPAHTAQRYTGHCTPG